ncbi:MAG: branched-chain amino acid ABC transporter permease [Thermoleophilia bacterium]|nr:branched-chain amino acid ABC transporter permease [Thermoleophilia bacterium]
MTPQLIWQSFVNGFALGWLYILMALGLSLIFGITRIMQFAHGELYMLGGYVVYLLTASLHLNLFLSIILAMVVVGAFGLLLYIGLFRRYTGQMVNPIIISVGLTLILQSAVVVTFGITQRSLPRLAEGGLSLFGSPVPKDRLVVVAVALALVVALYAALKKHRYGQAMVASVQSPEGAQLQGINLKLMGGLSMFTASALAAAGGALAGSVFQLTPYMGVQPLVKGLVIIVLGGLGSVPGVVVGGIFLGLLDGLAPVVLGAGWASILPLLVVMAVLLVRPTGLWGYGR